MAVEVLGGERKKSNKEEEEDAKKKKKKKEAGRPKFCSSEKHFLYKEDTPPPFPSFHLFISLSIHSSPSIHFILSTFQSDPRPILIHQLLACFLFFVCLRSIPSPLSPLH